MKKPKINYDKYWIRARWPNGAYISATLGWYFSIGIDFEFGNYVRFIYIGIPFVRISFYWENKK